MFLFKNKNSTRQPYAKVSNDWYNEIFEICNNITKEKKRVSALEEYLTNKFISIVNDDKIDNPLYEYVGYEDNIRAKLNTNYMQFGLPAFFERQVFLEVPNKDQFLDFEPGKAFAKAISKLPTEKYQKLLFETQDRYLKMHDDKDKIDKEDVRKTINFFKKAKAERGFFRKIGDFFTGRGKKEDNIILQLEDVMNNGRNANITYFRPGTEIVDEVKKEDAVPIVVNELDKQEEQEVKVDPKVEREQMLEQIRKNHDIFKGKKVVMNEVMDKYDHEQNIFVLLDGIDSYRTNRSSHSYDQDYLEEEYELLKESFKMCGINQQQLDEIIDSRGMAVNKIKEYYDYSINNPEMEQELLK